ncbi:Polynucleotide 5'-hydroxyl-kinase grc3, partial [Coemansia erecta]
MESLASRRSARVFTPRSSRSVRSSQTGSPVPSTQSPQANSTATQSPQAPSTTPDHQPVVATTWDATAPSLKIGAQKTGTRTELVALAASAPVSERHAVAFAMRAGETVVVQGIMDVCVLRGTVCVYEHECTGEWTRVYSPVSHPLVALHARAKDTVGGWDAEAERIRGLWGDCEGEYPVVVVIRAVDCGLDQIGRVAPAYGGLFAAAGGGGADGQLAQALGVPGATPVRLVQPGMQLLQTPGDWAAILDQAGTMPLQLDDAFEPTAPVFAVAGPQGLGKSTFARMLVNRLLARFGRVCYMETDLGQSEFAAPGALALTVVWEPVTGPPFTHVGQIEPLHAVYMGVVTPKNDPDRYAAAVQRLATVYGDYARAERARGQDAVVPLVVNTQGWTKGLGLDLLYALCQEVKPTHYVQAYDPVQAEAGDAGVLPLVDFESIGGCAPQMLWISAMSYERARHAMQQGDGVDVGAGDPAGRKGPRMSPHDMRALALLSLLYASPGRAWNMHRPLAARRALSVPLGDLVFWLGEEEVPPSQLLRALNGTVVGVVCVARAPGAGAHVWTADEVRGLYGADGISDQ